LIIFVKSFFDFFSKILKIFWRSPPAVSSPLGACNSLQEPGYILLRPMVGLPPALPGVGDTQPGSVPADSFMDISGQLGYFITFHKNIILHLTIFVNKKTVVSEFLKQLPLSIST
jgi:hypothetical protein